MQVGQKLSFYREKADLFILGAVTSVGIYTVGLLSARHGVRHTERQPWSGRNQGPERSHHLSPEGLCGKKPDGSLQLPDSQLAGAERVVSPCSRSHRNKQKFWARKGMIADSQANLL